MRRPRSKRTNVLKQLGPLFNFQSMWREDLHAAAELLGWNWRDVFEYGIMACIEHAEMILGVQIYEIKEMTKAQRAALLERRAKLARSGGEGIDFEWKKSVALRALPKARIPKTSAPSRGTWRLRRA